MVNCKGRDRLLDSKITKIEELHDYYQIYTENAVINIFNPFCIEDENGLIICNKNTIKEKLKNNQITV